MNVGIITFNSAHNYGAMLQTYALQTVIENKGFEVDIINYRLNMIDNVYNPFRRRRRNIFDLGFYKQRAGLHIRHRYKLEKFKNFENFMAENLNLTSVYKTFNDLMEDQWDHDFYIAGSDQIWNSKITKGLNPAYFFEFVPKKSKKIAYAASIGTDTLDDYDIPLFEFYLKNFDCISIREERSAQSLAECTDKPIKITVDPTLLLEKKYYDEIRNDLHFKDKEYIFFYTLEHNDELIQIAESISKKENLPVIFNRPTKTFHNQLESVPYIGPKEFLGVIANAKYVVTNSYHGAIFSIIYEKTFITAPNTKTPTRTKELIDSLGLEQALFTRASDFEDISKIKINYRKVEEKLNTLRENSIRFLENALVKDKLLDEEKTCYLDTEDNYSCYGCYACKEICPNGAITMYEDQEGFFYPFIDDSSCNHCDLCRNVCIYSKYDLKELKSQYPFVYAAYNNDAKKRMFSSSGGIFLPLAEEFIAKGGYVIGAAYNSEMVVEHKIGTTMGDCKEFSGSKYVRSDISGIFPKIKKLLVENKPVLFVGVPCQVAGLKSYLGVENENLYLVEILCHSNPSPKVFKKYIHYLEEKHQSKVTDFKFKDKTIGWNSPSVLIEFENGHSIRENGRYNDYNRGFQTSLMARPSCYNCEFVELNRVGDMTIADFWGIEQIEYELDDDKGISLVIVNNEKGNLLFENIKEKLTFVEEDMEKAFSKNHKYSIILNRRRTEFFSRLDNEPINDLLYSFNDIKKRYLENKKQLNPPLFKKILKKILPNKVKRVIRRKMV
jgi:coenzyme F420-reducing hydrogenase beta subunit